MKNVFVPAFFMLALCACKFNPERMAKDYCNCRADVEAGKKNLQECKDLAESHFLKMQENEDALKMYTEKILDCMSSAEIRQK